MQLSRLLKAHGIVLQEGIRSATWNFPRSARTMRMSTFDGMGRPPSSMERIGRFLAPHFSSSIGLAAPKNAATVPWRDDPNGVPPRKVFDDALISKKVREFRLQEDALQQKLTTNINQIEKEVQSAFIRDQIFHILCLDGGGVRGILTCNILLRILKQDPKFLDKTDALFGTSVGGILALLLASGYDPEECEEIFRFAMPHIFRHDPYRKMNPFNSKYSDRSRSCSNFWTTTTPDTSTRPSWRRPCATSGA